MTPRLSNRSFDRLLSFVGSYQLKILYVRGRVDFSPSQWLKLLGPEQEPASETIKLSDKDFNKFLPITGVSMMRWLASHNRISLTAEQEDELQTKRVDKISFLR